MNIPRDIYSILFIPFYILGLSLTTINTVYASGKGSIIEVQQSDCDLAIELNCLSSNMSVAYSLSSNLNTPQSSCEPDNGVELLRDVWFSFTADGESGYYLNAGNSNAGINVYAGSCLELELFDCAEANDYGGAFWVNEELMAGEYMFQVMSLGEGESLETTINFGCFENIISDCSVAIDFVEITDCVNEIGFADIAIGGSTNESYMTLELLVDGNLYFFDCLVSNGFWISNFQIQGETIEYVSVFAGNSESGCMDIVYEAIDMPIVNCGGTEAHLLKFYNEYTSYCSPLAAEVKMFQIGTTTLKHEFTAGYDEVKQSYIIQNPPIGTYDVFIKPLGSLQQGFGEIEIQYGTQTLLLDGIQKGDLNNSNSINIADISILSVAFPSELGGVNYNSLADFNCSGSINITDVSLFGSSFNQVGDSPPIIE